MKRTPIKLAVLSLAALALAACGGGGGGHHDDALDEVPASASASAEGLVSYLGELVKSLVAGDTSEPVSIDKFDPVKPDDTEPEVLT